MEATMQTSPDLDRRIIYAPRWNRTEGIARLRVWHAEHLAVVTELDDNTGPSVTNAIETIGDVVEALLGVRFAEHPTLMVPVTWQLAEHYVRSAMGGVTIDLVRFSGRDFEGHLEGPAWKHLQRSELSWLWDALATEDLVPGDDGELT